ncbi:MAG: hypothetical protein Q8R15_00645 [Candidatus Micrarchaeota archaeon]|nr:hypothetical protein [Candidatus Micrarchaeota archaeon]
MVDINMARGKERQVICASCKRYCRRDKAVYIEKVVFSNPIERKDTTEQEEYKAVFKREVAYCPGCGKHLRIYEKKTEENRRNREREIERASQRPTFREQTTTNNNPTRSRTGGYKLNEPTQPQSPTARQ